MASDDPDSFAGMSIKSLKCSLCSNYFNRPKFLNCLHTFCLKCLKNWVKKNNGILECPTCYAPHDIPEGGVQKFPTNGVMRGLVDHLTSMEKTEPQLCSNCLNEADSYCTNCDYFYCQECVKIHKHAKKTNMHSIITLQEYKELGPAKQLEYKILFCKDHNLVDMKLYCDKCKKSVCIECAHVEHKDQEHTIKEGKDVFKEFTETASRKLTESEAKESELRQAEDKLKSIQSSLLGNKENCRTAINEHFDAIQQRLDAQKEQRIKELDKIFDDNLEIVKKKIKEVESIIIQLQSTRELTTNLIKSPNATLALMNSNMISTRVDILLKFQTEVESLDTTAWKFFPVNTFLEELNGDHFGKIKRISPKLSTIENANDIRVLVGENVSFTMTTKDADGGLCYDEFIDVTAKMTTSSEANEINLDVIDNKDGSYEICGKSCNEAGMWKLTVSVGSSCVGDSPLFFNAVKSGLCSATDLRDYCNQCELHNINVIGKSIFACFSRNRNIVKLGKDGVEVIDMKHLGGSKVLSLCAGNVGEMVLACHDTNEGNVILCKDDGTFIKEFNNLKVGRIQGMMAVKDNEIYIPDNDRNCVLRVSLSSGQLLAKIPSGSPSNVIRFPKGVAITEDGALLVCSYWTNQVVMFDKTGVFVKVFVDEGEDTDGKVYSPYSVAVDEEGNVVVGSLHRLQLFSKNGEFIKRIDDAAHVLYCPGSVICRRRQVITADKRNATVCVYNY